MRTNFTRKYCPCNKWNIVAMYRIHLNIYPSIHSLLPTQWAPSRHARTKVIPSIICKIHTRIHSVSSFFCSFFRVRCGWRTKRSFPTHLFNLKAIGIGLWPRTLEQKYININQSCEWERDKEEVKKELNHLLLKIQLMGVYIFKCGLRASYTYMMLSINDILISHCIMTDNQIVFFNDSFV